MFVIYLKFSTNKPQAPNYMAAHNAWIKNGFESGKFLIVGSLKPNLGGAIIAHNADFEEIENIVKSDPFVQNDIVTYEINEISINKNDERLGFIQ